MILDQHRYPTRTSWDVTLANMETKSIEGYKLVTEGGALAILDTEGFLVVAFGPGAWLEVQRS